MTSAVHFVNTVLCVANCVRRCRKSDGVLRPFRRRTTNAEPHPFALWRRIPWAAPSSPSPDRRSSRLLGDVVELRTGRDASDALMTRHRNPETRTSWWRLECEVDDSVYIKKRDLVMRLVTSQLLSPWPSPCRKRSSASVSFDGTSSWIIPPQSNCKTKQTPSIRTLYCNVDLKYLAQSIILLLPSSRLSFDGRVVRSCRSLRSDVANIDQQRASLDTCSWRHKMRV